MKRRQFFGTLAGMVAAPAVRCETMPAFTAGAWRVSSPIISGPLIELSEVVLTPERVAAMFDLPPDLIATIESRDLLP